MAVQQYPSGFCVHELFDIQAVARPAAIAAIHGQAQVTYGELKVRSDALAARLVEAGVRRGDRVGVCGSRGLDALVAFVGVLKAGAAYVPLEATLPPRRLRAVAEDAGVQVAVTLPGHVCRVRRLRTQVDLQDVSGPRDVADAGPAPSARGPRRPGPPEGSDEDCAYVMATSGSTGRPKSVAIPHRGVVALAASDRVGQRPRPEDRVLHAYSLSSDASTIEIWSTLLAGACLVLIDREDLLSPTTLRARLRAGAVTIAYLTTGVFHHVARTLPSAFASLRFVSAGGEAMDPDLTRAVLRSCPDTTVVNFYGPTENTVVSTGYVVREIPDGARSVPIGAALEHGECLVFRPDGSLAGPEQDGELFVGGAGLALGYLGDPETTARRFVPHPTRPGARLYRTGDWVRWRGDGQLEYQGRLDRQVKLRGHRIELDGIEARLRADEAVAEAAVELDGQNLVAYVTPARLGERVPLARLRQRLTEWLPTTAVPAEFVQLERFPVNASGKIDRRMLRASAAQASAASDAELEPATLTETAPPDGLVGRLAQLWQDVLRVRPRAQDSFFDLGGDSLLAAEVVTRALTALELDPTLGRTLVSGLLAAPTLSGFAAAVESVITESNQAGPVAAAADDTIDFRAEGRLGFTVGPARGPAPDSADPREALLTGASGFVGAFLLDRLLASTRARVHCPVRARDDAHARRRVLDNLRRYGLTAPTSPDRLVCFAADLAAPHMGMGAEGASELAERVDLIIHSAARANFVYPYRALSADNVEATRQIARLAAPRRVPVHFLSTIAVLAGFGSAGVRHVDEDTPLDHADRLSMGYAESKWVAELVLADAARQGVPVSVYRPYEITGDQHTGACNTETAICSLFKVIAETGVAPDIPLPMDFVPVDYVANAVVRIATNSPGAAGSARTYHLTNPRPARLRDVLNRMRRAGYRIDEVPYRQWVDGLVAYVASHPTSATTPFVSLCVDRGNKSDLTVKELFFTGTFPELGRTRLEHALTGSGLRCPAVDAALLDRYLAFLTATGYLPPAAVNATTAGVR